MKQVKTNRMRTWKSAHPYRQTRLSALLLMVAAVLPMVFTSCKVEFSPNAPWRDVPAVYCVLDPEVDTVWVRVQRCYLGEDTLYNYSPIADSNYYNPNDIEVHLLAWKGLREDHNFFSRSDELKHRWTFTYTEREGQPDGDFPLGLQPLYYCVPEGGLIGDTDCVFQLVILRSATGDTLAQAFTTMVGMRIGIERIITRPNDIRESDKFGFITGCRGEVKWNTLPRGRLYQPVLTFYYLKGEDTLSLDIVGTTTANAYDYPTLTAQPFTEQLFLSTIQRHLANNTDTLYTVDQVDITLAVCNEDLNAYIQSQSTTATGGQEYQSYSNIKGGVGVFGSRRSKIKVTVPCDADGKEGHIPDQLLKLGVGFYGNFGK